MQPKGGDYKISILENFIIIFVDGPIKDAHHKMNLLLKGVLKTN
jgi:hypothetical protein